MHQRLIDFVKDVYQTKAFIPLHEPTFTTVEKQYLNDVIDSTFVSSVGRYVDEFEQQLVDFTKAPKAVAVVNGTAALHACLYLAGVRSGDMVITQAVTFVATCNALYHMGATPAFVDVEMNSLSLCPEALSEYLEDNGRINDDGFCVHKTTGQVIRAVVPMHTFGHPADLDRLVEVCERWHLCLVEDAAESLGSYYKGQHTGTIGRFAALSFNGNKVITTGGGGAILCRSADDGVHAKHVTTTAKVPHRYEFYHDEPGFNYRMPNLNAALGCAQLSNLSHMLSVKRTLAGRYDAFFAGSDFRFIKEPEYAHSNYWLNAVMCPNKTARDELLKHTNDNGVMTRPIWQLMTNLPMFVDAPQGRLDNSLEIEQCLINIPSTPFK